MKYRCYVEAFVNVEAESEKEAEEKALLILLAMRKADKDWMFSTWPDESCEPENKWIDHQGGNV